MPQMLWFLVWACFIASVCLSGAALGQECAGTSCSSCTATMGCGWCNSTSCIPIDNSDANSTCWEFVSDPTHCSEEATCNEYKNCSTCINATGCGWCLDLNTKMEVCLAGNKSQPFDSAHCLLWETDTCPRDCRTIGNCLDCTREKQCGWCNTTSKCDFGDSSGPFEGTCRPNQWWVDNKCGSTPLEGCGNYKSCDTCVRDKICGWCVDRETCFRREQVPANCEFFRIDSCADPCAQYKSCGDCLTDDKSCGWCNGTSCVSGSNRGPMNATCPVWQVGGVGSCGNTNCSDYTDCGTCLGASHCAWCEYSKPAQCLFVPVWPPQVGTPQCPHDFFWEGCPSPINCTAYTTCLECTGLKECWWCGYGNGCHSDQTYPICFGNEQRCNASPSPPPKDGDGDGLSGGAIAGITLSVLFVAFAIVMVAAFAWYRLYWVKRHYYLTLK